VFRVLKKHSSLPKTTMDHLSSCGRLTFVRILILLSFYGTCAFPLFPLSSYKCNTQLHAVRTNDQRSKRQERVGQLVRIELGKILHQGSASRAEILDAELRQRISVVKADVSPDLRQARISISVSASLAREDTAMDKRRAYAWLVNNAKPLRHALAQKLSHMKSCPELKFVQVDVAAAVDVMYLIDKISSGNDKRSGSLLGESPSGVMGGIDFDLEMDDEDDWEEEDEDFFLTED
jgi:ribosome-binding factor A